MATSQLNYYANYVGSFIILLVFLVGIVIIIDEIYNICRFCYRYTYLYNYGSLNEATCKDNKLECETARFKIYNELPRYKFDKDIEKQNRIIELAIDIKRYFASSYWNGINDKNTVRPYLTIIRNLFKNQGFLFINKSFIYNTGENGKVKTTRYYIIKKE